MLLWNCREVFTSVTALSLCAHASAYAQTPLPDEDSAPILHAPIFPSLPPAPAPDIPWYQKLKVRGYTQLRYNHLPSFHVNPDLINAQGDRSIGGKNNFFMRRARVILYGDIHDWVSIYLQPDFASSIGDQQHVAILRDWYADVFLNKTKEFRLRIGQSKVPFGFENMQSSSNRLALDRNDALNSAVKDERDIGAVFYWAPNKVRSRFRHLTESGLKGSGDYGVLALGAYNGQTANRPELNDNVHVVGRLTWPFLFGRQFIEPSVFGYRGRYTIRMSQPGDGTIITSAAPDNTHADWRVGGAVVVYPQPLGFQAEWNVGRGPALGRFESTTIRDRNLHGGYAQMMYKYDAPGGQFIIPFVRATYYEGGKKFEANAPRYSVRELETGIEWQPYTAIELVVAYNISDRTADRYPYRQEQGHVTRVQLQFIY